MFTDEELDLVEQENDRWYVLALVEGNGLQEKVHLEGPMPELMAKHRKAGLYDREFAPLIAAWPQHRVAWWLSQRGYQLKEVLT